MYSSKVLINELSCSIVTDLSAARAAPGARAAPAAPTTAIFRKSRRDLLLIAPSPRLCRAAGLGRPSPQRRIVLLLPRPRKLLDVTVGSRRIDRRAADSPQGGNRCAPEPWSPPCCRFSLP